MKNEARRIGKFLIKRLLIESNPGFAKRVLRNMLIVRAESMFAYDAIEYTAFSDMFPPVEQGDVIPFYKIEATRTSDNRVYLKAVPDLSGKE